MKRAAMTPARWGNPGFTLIELLVIIAIAGIVLTPVLITFAETTIAAMETWKVHVATFLAQDLMEEIRTRRFDEDTPGGGGVVADPDNNIGLEAGELAAGPRSAYDDVDDYHLYSESPITDQAGNVIADFTGYTRTVVVQYVDSPAFDTVVAGPTDYKRVTVTVSWQGATRSVRIRLVIGNF